MRKRRFRAEIPDQLLPGSRVVTAPVPHVRPDAPFLAAKKASPRTKRLVALCVVILVSASIPILALTLILAG